MEPSIHREPERDRLAGATHGSGAAPTPAPTREPAAALALALSIVALPIAGCASGAGPGVLHGETAGAAARAAGLPPAVIARRVAEVEALERRRFAAMVAVDRAVLDEVLGERLRYCHSDGRCETKPQFIEALASGRMRYRAIEVLELEPKLVGTAMVVHGRLGIQAESQGQAVQFRMVFTDVYEPTPAGWRMVAWQSTRLP